MLRLLWFSLTLLILAAAGFGAYTCFNRRLPTAEITVSVPPGSTFAEAAKRLEEAGGGAAWSLRLLARLSGESTTASGDLLFPPHETLFERLDHLTRHAEEAAVWVTIPEGYTAVQIGQRLSAAHILGGRTFAAYAHHTHTFFGRAATRSLEGYLFPDTYRIDRDADAAHIAAAMLLEFRHRLPADAERQAHHLGYNVPQIVTIASLIEREARVDAERPLMAGIYYRRMHIGMPLQVDATLEYALPHHKTILTERDLQRQTPYNTYRYRGLPPTPIANPGLPSLLAALHPRATTALYYVYRGHGRHAFATTLQEHEANVLRYL